jgi:subfamily B ATP-binding cassette protein HlyB/CyaB
MSIDSGLQSLALLARIHQISIDVAQLQHRFGRDDQPCSSGQLLRAARSLGLRARSYGRPISKVDSRVLPAIALDRNGDYFIVARLISGRTGRRYLIQRPHARNPEFMDTAELEAICAGELILARPQGNTIDGWGRTFNLQWFIPVLLKYRRVFADVLLASFFLQLFALVTPLFFQVVMDKVLVHQGFTTLNVLALGFLVLVLFEAVVGGMRNYLFTHTTNRVDVELGARLFRHLAMLPLSYFENRQVGQTVARVRELDSLRNFITGTALTLLVDLSFAFVFVAVLWYYSPMLTWIVLGSLPGYVLLSLWITPLLRHRLDLKFRHGAINQAFLTETISGIQTVKTQALELQMQGRWEDQLANYIKASFAAQNLNNIAGQVAGLVSKVTTLLIIWQGAHLVIAGSLSVGQLVAFNMIAGRLTAPILKLVQLWQDFQHAGISLERLGDILNTPPEPGFTPGRTTPGQLEGEIRFDRVRFRYRPDGPVVIDGLNLTIKAGERIGLVGMSGSGKSTLAKLVQRLYIPESGRILVDGRDLAIIDSIWLRQRIGVVQQDSFLFNRSVRENIAVSSPGLSFEIVEKCARMAGAHSFILDLPEAYDTIVGEQGCNLSGGQRQRIAIARALVSDPRVLILDEATSALDYESERIVQDKMELISQGRTIIVIAHRLSTVRQCDRILVMDGGTIAEEGSHDELIVANGCYANLYRYQIISPWSDQRCETGVSL